MSKRKYVVIRTFKSQANRDLFKQDPIKGRKKSKDHRVVRSPESLNRWYQKFIRTPNFWIAYELHTVGSGFEVAKSGNDAVEFLEGGKS